MKAHAPTSTADRLPSLLKQVFGYDSFRPLQEDIMTATLGGLDTVAILPTGAGKSLCYQLPALVREGLTVVVSPLIALMKDQVDQLHAAGVAATYLNSTLDPAELRSRHEDLDAGKFQLLYVAPERLLAGDFPRKLAGWKVAAIAVDEAHCISEWGHDFRPEYRQLATLRERFPGVPFLALTATATPRVREDIIFASRLTVCCCCYRHASRARGHHRPAPPARSAGVHFLLQPAEPQLSRHPEKQAGAAGLGVRQRPTPGRGHHLLRFP